MSVRQTPPLYQLARLYNVQTAYYDAFGRRRQPSPQALLFILRALGSPVEGMADFPNALRERREWMWRRCIEPVILAWGGGPVRLELRLPEKEANGFLTCRLKLETGEVRKWAYRLPRLFTAHASKVEGTRYLVKWLYLPVSLPLGYHRLTLELEGRSFNTQLISAPIKAYTGLQEQGDRAWGVFLPLYALRSEKNWGSGDFSDLEALASWVKRFGGGIVATLPLLAAFLDEPFEPCPYLPASRLFWNEFYLDVTRIPDLERCRTARALLASSAFHKEIEALRQATLVDYRRQMALKRKVLEILTRFFFAKASDRQASFQGFVKGNPSVEDYARFRATCERQRAPWPRWPQRLRDGVLRSNDYDQENERYHLYVQWLAHEQLSAVAKKTKATSQVLYLDLPLGIHAHGYDVWRERNLFALDVSAGAPPDTFFTQGQNWGFPPFHPEALRENGYRYYLALLRHHMKHAGLLRIDHVMALHRLFWIPKGLAPSEATYVHYPSEEFYAILSLESHRHRSLIVGENLGTVPTYVNRSMTRHNIHGMYVLQYELQPDSKKALRPISRKSLASLNTHDMPPFSAFWQGLDIADRLELGLLDPAGARRERKNRQDLKKALLDFVRRGGWLKSSERDMRSVLRAVLMFLSAGPARFVLANLEDLWLEKFPQNVPGTVEQRLNWQRKARYGFEVFSQMSEAFDILHEINHRRRRQRTPE